jgi:TolB-like protein
MLHDVSAKEVRAATEKIAGSEGFTGATRQQKLLRYIVEQSIQGESSNVKEYVLGLEVFDRPSSFDPRTDSIVRVEARKLRINLEKYYRTAGQHDEIVIQLPKGAYVPVFERRPVDVGAPAALSAPSLTAPASRRKWLMPVAALSLLVVIGAGFIAFAPGPPRMAAGQKHSLAVLPFVNLSSEPESGYFADGLTEQLIHALSGVEGLRVVARTSAYQFKNAKKDIRDIGAALRVSLVLEGSVRKEGRRLVALAQLIDVGSGFHLWSKAYDREVTEALSIQREIADAIVDTLKYQKGSLDEERLASRNAGSAAYEPYLNGLYAENRATRQGLERSISHFQKAIEKDAGFTPAYQGLASSYVALGIYGYWPPGESMPKAKAAAEKAIALGGSIAEAHAILGFTNAVYDWNWAESERHFKQSINRNPGCAACRAWYSLYCLAPMDRAAEANAELAKAVDLDPLSIVFQSFRIAVPLYLGQDGVAISEANQVLTPENRYFAGHLFFAGALRRQGKLQEAAAAAQRAAELSGQHPLALRTLAEIQATQGKPAEARAIVDRLMEAARKQYVSPSAFFYVYQSLNERAKALEWLDKSVEAHDPYLIFMRSWPLREEFRKHPQVEAVRKRVGLPVS